MVFVVIHDYVSVMMQNRLLAIGALACAAALLALTAPADAAAKKKPHPHKPAPQHQAVAPAPAAATGPAQTLGTAGSWTAYMSKDDTGRVCYLFGEAQKTEPAGFKHKPAMVMVTHRPEEHVENVVSFIEGYPLKDGSDAALDVDGGKFALFTKDDGAWARTSELDKTITTALAKGKRAVVKTTPQKGSVVTDFYSLTGFGKALSLIDKACGVKR